MICKRGTRLNSTEAPITIGRDQVQIANRKLYPDSIDTYMLSKEITQLSKLLWSYHQMGQLLEKTDCILVLGSHDYRVAERGAQLWLEGWAPVLIFSGGLGNLTKDMWKETEADQFAAIAMKMGVPKESILIENKSTNTGENILFSQQLLKENNLDPQSFIVVQKPYMERRSYATFKRHWPDKKVMVTSPQLGFDNYPNCRYSCRKSDQHYGGRSATDQAIS